MAKYQLSDNKNHINNDSKVALLTGITGQVHRISKLLIFDSKMWRILWNLFEDGINFLMKKKTTPLSRMAHIWLNSYWKKDIQYTG